MVADELAQAADEHGQDHDLVHAGEALVDVLSPAEQAVGHDLAFSAGDAAEQAHQTAEQNARGQDDEGVEPGQGQHQHGHVGQDADQLEVVQGHFGAARGREPEQGHGEQGGGQDDEEVHAELVAHLAALGAGGGDGGVRDHGQVVAEHGPAQHHAHEHGHLDAGLGGHAQGDGRDGGHGAHAGAHGRGHEGADEEQAGQDEGRGHQRKAEIHRGVDTADGRGRGGETARQQVDHAHGDDVDLAHAGEEDGDLLGQTGPALHQGQGDGGQDGHGGGELVEGHVHAGQAQADARADEDEQKEQQGQDGGKGSRRFRLFLRGRVGLRVHDASARGKVDGMAAGPRAPPALGVGGCAARRARRRMSRYP